CWRRCATSSSATARTSTTGSSTSWPSPPEVQESHIHEAHVHECGFPEGRRVAVVACGAIAAHVAAVVGRRGWPVEVHPLPPLLHNHPERIAAEVDQRVSGLTATDEAEPSASAGC